MNQDKSAAQLAYEADVLRRPKYHDGAPRCSWDELCDIAKWSWGRPPFRTNEEVK